jgi:hypothetical protein
MNIDSIKDSIDNFRQLCQWLPNKTENRQYFIDMSTIGALTDGVELCHQISATGLIAALIDLVVSYIQQLPETIEFREATKLLVSGVLSVQKSFDRGAILVYSGKPYRPILTFKLPKRILWGFSNRNAKRLKWRPCGDVIWFKKCDIPEMCEFIDAIQNAARDRGVIAQPQKPHGQMVGRGHTPDKDNVVFVDVLSENNKKNSLAFPVKVRVSKVKRMYRKLNVWNAHEFLSSGALVNMFVKFEITKEGNVAFPISKIDILD